MCRSWILLILEGVFMSRLLIAGGVVGALVGLGFVLPALAQLRDGGALPGFGKALGLFGAALMLAGAGVVGYGVRGARG
jgi:hypothetical protein